MKSFELQQAIENAINAKKQRDNELGIVSTSYSLRPGMTFARIGPTGLEIGARVIGFLGLGGNESGTFYVYSLPDENGVQMLVEDGFRNRFLTWNIFENDRPVSEQFGIGLYWDDEEPGAVKSADELARLYHRCDVQKRWNQRKEDNDRKAYEAAVTRLKKQYKGVLVPLDTVKDWSERNKTEKANLLALLKHEFPGVRFTARLADHYRPTITWTDGPSVDQVSSVASHFVISGHTRMDDYYEEFPSAFNNTFGGFSYGFEYNRKYTGDLLERLGSELIQAVKEETAHWSGVEQPGDDYIPSSCAYATIEAIQHNAERWHITLDDDFDMHKGYGIRSRIQNAYGGRAGIGWIAEEVAELIDLRPAEEPKPAKKVTTTTTATTTTDEAPHKGLELVDIPGGVAVVGDTRTTFYNRKAIKAHGARWNKEAQRWEATDPADIETLRNWFALAA